MYDWKEKWMLRRLLSLPSHIHSYVYICVFHVYIRIFMYIYVHKYVCIFMYIYLLSELYILVQLFYVSPLYVGLKAKVYSVVSFKRAIGYRSMWSCPHLRLLAPRAALPHPPSQHAPLSVNKCSVHFHCRCMMLAVVKDLLMETVPLGLLYWSDWWLTIYTEFVRKRGWFFPRGVRACACVCVKVKTRCDCGVVL